MKQLFLLAGSVLMFLCFSMNLTDSEAPAMADNLNKKNPEAISKILFSRRNADDKGWSIYMVNPDGGDEKIFIPFSSGMGEYNPAVSPDGKSMLFNTYRYGGWKLAEYDIENKSTKRITISSDYYYFNGVFSPSGKKIAYERNVGKDIHIFMADKDGDNEILLTAKMEGENRVPVWTPDGKSIIFYSEKNKVNDIYCLGISSGKIKNLTNNISGNDFDPAVSPDGKQVAFFSDRNGFLDLYIMDISGANQINLTSALQSKYNEYNYYKDNNMFWIFKTSWSPDGRSLVFSNIKKDNFDLFTIKKDGTDLRQITDSPKSEFTPVWGLVELKGG